MIDFAALKAHFPADKVSWRVGMVSKDKTKASALAYIDARDVMERLDGVCGPEHWQCKYTHANGKTVCDIGILVSVNDDSASHQWVWKADGAGDSDIEAEKGALSDAFKRAAVRWGIGRYLYDLPMPWVEIDEFKHFTASAKERLYSILNKDGLKQHTLEGQAKKPAGFWGNEKLNLYPPKNIENTDQARSWLVENFRKGVDKAPNRELLAKFQSDNETWIDNLDPTKTHELYEICSIRAAQFDQLGEKNG